MWIAITKKFPQIVKQMQAELEKSKRAQGREGENYLSQIQQLQRKAQELEAALNQKTKSLEAYKQELKHFRCVPGIHNFGEVSKQDGSDAKNNAKIIDKTESRCSANPDHHYPNHRRGCHRPT